LGVRDAGDPDTLTQTGDTPGTLGLNDGAAASSRAAPAAGAELSVVNPETIPLSWRQTPLPSSGGEDVYLYRGFARNVETHRAAVVRPDETGGILSRRPDAAQDAIFNQYGRDPVLAGPQAAGVVRVRVPAALWDELVRTNSLSERAGYPGFSRQLSSTEIRVNSPEAAQAINKLPNEVIPPDAHYDYRPGAIGPASPKDGPGG